MVKRAGVLFGPREFPCDFLWGCMNDLVYSVPTDTIDVLRERLENAATTIRNDRGMLERVEESFRRRTITTVTLNTSCND
jgi:hypothetical protein